MSNATGGRLAAGPERLSRHWLNLACLARHDAGRCLLEDVVRHKTVFFDASYANFYHCLDGRLRLDSGNDQLASLRSDHDAMRRAGIRVAQRTAPTPGERSELLHKIGFATMNVAHPFAERSDCRALTGPDRSRLGPPLLRSRPAGCGGRARHDKTAIEAPVAKLRRLAAAVFLAGIVGCTILLSWASAAALTAGDSWRGLTVAPEHRCTPYVRRNYPYPQSIEAVIVASMGGRIYGPYTGRYFATTRQSDIEHIVAVSEAHDSGLCGADHTTRRRFASDPLNLTLAAPAVNRCGPSGKCALDAGAWLPPMNRCWFAGRVVVVKRKYGLTIDRREAAALERVLSACASTDMVFATDLSMPTPAKPKARSPAASDDPVDALKLYDDNRNGRITCSEARRHGIAPVPRGHPAYRFMRDGDGDGVVCE